LRFFSEVFAKVFASDGWWLKVGCQSRLEDLYQVFNELFFDLNIVHDCVMGYSIDNTCVARVELDENGDVKGWQAMGPAVTYQIQGLLAAMEYWWKVEV
jgi:hypothetical protein